MATIALPRPAHDARRPLPAVVHSAKHQINHDSSGRASPPMASYRMPSFHTPSGLPLGGAQSDALKGELGAHVMVYDKDRHRWVSTQRRPPRGLQALADDPERLEQERRRLAELRPSWGGVVPPTKPLVAPPRRAAAVHYGHHDDETTTPTKLIAALHTAREPSSLPPVGGSSSPAVSSGAHTARPSGSHTKASEERRRRSGIPDLQLLQMEAAGGSFEHEHHHRSAHHDETTRVAGTSAAASAAIRQHEAASTELELAAFDRRVPYVPVDADPDDDDDENIPARGGQAQHKSLRAGGHAISALARMAHATSTSHSSNHLNPDRKPANPLPGLLVNVPVHRVFEVYRAMETPTMRRYGMSQSDFGDMLCRLLPSQIRFSDELLGRAFDAYEPMTRTPDTRLDFVSFLATYGRENCSAAIEHDLLFMFDVLAGAYGVRASTTVRLAAASAAAIASGGRLQPAAGTVSKGAASTRGGNAINNSNVKLAPVGSPSLPAITPRRLSMSLSAARSILTRPQAVSMTAAAASGAQDGAVGATAQPVLSNDPQVALAQTLASPNTAFSAALLQADTLRDFTRRCVRTGGARAAWLEVADALEAESESIVGILRSFLAVDTSAFQPVAPRSELERKLLGEPAPVPFPRLSLQKWRFLVYSSPRLLRCMRGLWFPEAANATASMSAKTTASHVRALPAGR